jgi:hypothetical protein
MAEMAALLVLRQKWEAFCSEDAEGSPALLTAARRSSSSARRMPLARAWSELAPRSAFACARSNAGARHFWVIVTATIAAKAAHAWCCTG